VNLGDTAVTVRRFSAEDVAEYHDLCGRAGAPGTVPEPLIGGLFSYLLGVELPGAGTNYLKQETRFHAPAHIGELLTATVEVSRIRPEKHLVDLSTTCTDPNGRPIASGRALVYIGDAG
jgi:acyl dehydratase